MLFWMSFIHRQLSHLLTNRNNIYFQFVNKQLIRKIYIILAFCSFAESADNQLRITRPVFLWPCSLFSSFRIVHLYCFPKKTSSYRFKTRLTSWIHRTSRCNWLGKRIHHGERNFDWSNTRGNFAVNDKNSHWTVLKRFQAVDKSIYTIKL